MIMFDAGNVTAKQARPLFNVALGEFLFLTQFAEAVAYNHGCSPPRNRCKRVYSRFRYPRYVFMSTVEELVGEEKGSLIEGSPLEAQFDYWFRLNEENGLRPKHSRYIGLHRPNVPNKQSLLSFPTRLDRKSTRLNSSHQIISYAVFCLKKKKIAASRDSSCGRRLTFGQWLRPYERL